MLGKRPTPGELWKERDAGPFTPVFARVNRVEGRWVQIETKGTMQDMPIPKFLHLYKYVARWHSKNRKPTEMKPMIDWKELSKAMLVADIVASVVFVVTYELIGGAMPPAYIWWAVPSADLVALVVMALAAHI